MVAGAWHLPARIELLVQKTAAKLFFASERLRLILEQDPLKKSRVSLKRDSIEVVKIQKTE